MDAVEYLDPQTINGLNLYAYCSNNSVSGYDPKGTWDWGHFSKGASWLVIGVSAICAGVSVLTCGVATPLMAAVATVTIVAATATIVNGVSEIGEAATGCNFMRDKVFQGNEKIYDIYSNTTATVAEIGKIVCGGWLKVNKPRIQAYKNIGNANFPGDYYAKNIASRPYFDSLLTQKNIIKYGKMTKNIGKNGKLFYSFSVNGTALINGSLNSGMYELVLTSDYKLIWHLLFN